MKIIRTTNLPSYTKVADKVPHTVYTIELKLRVGAWTKAEVIAQLLAILKTKTPDSWTPISAKVTHAVNGGTGTL